MKRLAVVVAVLFVAVLSYLVWQRIDVDSRTFRLKAIATILMWESNYGDFFFRGVTAV